MSLTIGMILHWLPSWSCWCFSNDLCPFWIFYLGLRNLCPFGCKEKVRLSFCVSGQRSHPLAKKVDVFPLISWWGCTKVPVSLPLPCRECVGTPVDKECVRWHCGNRNIGPAPLLLNPHSWNLPTAFSQCSINNNNVNSVFLVTRNVFRVRIKDTGCHLQSTRRKMLS
jgi:hypothetical protein